MKQKGSGVLWLWAVRDLSRRPWDALLTAAVIWLLIAVAGTVVLLTFSLSGTAEKVLENAPAIVVRRVDTGGWVPIPVGEAAAIAGNIRGVTGVRPRVWGIVRASDGPVTAIAWDKETRKSPTELAKICPNPERPWRPMGYRYPTAEPSPCREVTAWS